MYSHAKTGITKRASAAAITAKMARFFRADHDLCEAFFHCPAVFRSADPSFHHLFITVHPMSILHTEHFFPDTGLLNYNKQQSLHKQLDYICFSSVKAYQLSLLY